MKLDDSQKIAELTSPTNAMRMPQNATAARTSLLKMALKSASTLRAIVGAKTALPIPLARTIFSA